MTGALLDALLPGDGRFPPASALGLADLLAGHPRFGGLLAPVLALLPPDFDQQDSAGRHAALQSIEQAAPEPFSALLTGAYSLYYSHPTVAAVIADQMGHAPGPPQPRGHDLEPFDPALVGGPLLRAKGFRGDGT